VQITYPPLDGDCLIKILRGEGHDVDDLEGSPFAYLKRGDLLPWEIAENSIFYGPEIEPIFRSIGLKIELLQAYKDKYCSDPPEKHDPSLN
jgi:hypothetical protein